jgi:hypothetical protein
MRDPFRSVICDSVEVLYGRQQCSGARSKPRALSGGEQQRVPMSTPSAVRIHAPRGGAVDPIPQTPLFLWSTFDFLSGPYYKGAR